MAAALGVTVFLRKMEEQHQELINQIAVGTIRTLTEENHRLTDQLSSQSLEKLKQGKRISPQPDVPPLPPRLFTPPVMMMHLPRPSWIQASTTTPTTPFSEHPPIKEIESPIKEFGVYSPEQKALIPTSRNNSMIAARRAMGSRMSEAWEQPSRKSDPMAMTKSIIGNSARKQDQRRIKNLLGMDYNSQFLSYDSLYQAMRDKRPECSFSTREIQDIHTELRMLQLTHGMSEQKEFLLVSAFIELIYMPELLSLVHTGLRAQMQVMVKALQRTTIEEVINEATRSGHEKVAVVANVTNSDTQPYETPLNIVVMTVVIINLVSMGVSIDWNPNHWCWLLLEAICAAIFLFECSFKVYHLGIREYCTGEQRWWNRLDAAITMTSVTEVTVSLVTAVVEFGGGSGSKSGLGAITPMLRVLRATRVVRLVKLLRFKVMRELASMLVGIVIGLPALFWVFLLFMLVVFVLGTCFRVILGPTAGQDQLSTCGLPDLRDEDEIDCLLHWLYGEEFFGTVKKSMFTTFRFMIGDFSTGAGKSLAVAFSRGYGAIFELTYCIGMISVMFGLFNVITAIFVDSTISGLQHSDVKKKHSRQYESRFVREKLKDLLNHIAVLRSSKHDMGRRTSGVGKKSYFVETDTVENLQLDEQEFFEVIENEVVMRILEDLDVKISNANSMYDTFDPDGNGFITVSSLVDAIMKLRGEPQKNDLIASWQALRALHEKVDHLLAQWENNNRKEAMNESFQSQHDRESKIGPKAMLEDA